METRQALGIKTTAERTAEVNGTAEPPAAPTASVEDAVPEAEVGPATPGGGAAAAGGAQGQAPAPAATPIPVAAGGLAFTPGTAAVDAPYCSTCGVRMRPAGSCFVCESCGTTSGCS